MPEGTTPEVGPPITSQSAVTGEGTSPTELQTPRINILNRVLGMFRRKPESPNVKTTPDESPETIRDRLARLHADRLNLKSAIESSDSTGSSRLADNQRLEQISARIADLQSRLPSEPAPSNQRHNDQQAA